MSRKDYAWAVGESSRTSTWSEAALALLRMSQAVDSYAGINEWLGVGEVLRQKDGFEDEMDQY